MNPHDIQTQDISSVYFDPITRVSNIRYLNAQQISLDHRVKEREINCALQEDIVAEGDGIYSEYGGFRMDLDGGKRSS